MALDPALHCEHGKLRDQCAEHNLAAAMEAGIQPVPAGDLTVPVDDDNVLEQFLRDGAREVAAYFADAVRPKVPAKRRRSGTKKGDATT